MSQNALGRLHDLAVFVRAEEDLRTHLGELVDLAASVTDASACSIMLLSEGEHEAPRLKLWASTELFPSLAWNETPGRGESIADRVLEQLGQASAAPGTQSFELAQHKAELIGPLRGTDELRHPVVAAQGHHPRGIILFEQKPCQSEATSQSRVQFHLHTNRSRESCHRRDESIESARFPTL